MINHDEVVLARATLAELGVNAGSIMGSGDAFKSILLTRTENGVEMKADPGPREGEDRVEFFSRVARVLHASNSAVIAHHGSALGCFLETLRFPPADSKGDS